MGKSTSSHSGKKSPPPAARPPAGPVHMSPGDEAPPGTPGTGENICRACAGSGSQYGRPCPQCEGTGSVITGIGGA